MKNTRRHRPGHFPEGRFALLHRERRWNPSEGVWMGWERKRGKLHELNRLILAAQDVSLGDRSSGYRVLIPNPRGGSIFPSARALRHHPGC